jgi:anti-sigma regulatory factor (Ser/Thr protein kinase)
MSVCQDHHDAPVLRLSLQPGPDAASAARAAIAEFSENHGLDTETLATTMLLVSELVTNAVRHADVEPPDDISLLARLAHAVIRVEITDRGSGFAPQARDPRRIDGGYGLYLLDKAAARWGVEHRDGTTVWFEVPAQLA